MIAIIAPTGNSGRHVVRDLLNRDEALRLAERDPAKLPAEVRGARQGRRELARRR